MNLRPGQMVTIVAGLVLLVFSFLSFFEIDGAAEFREQCESIPAELREQFAAECDAVSGDGMNAWSTDLLFPVGTWPTILGVVVAGITAAMAFANAKIPEVLGFDNRQLLAGLAVPGAIIMIGFLIAGSPEGGSFGIGFWLLLLGSLALLAGTVMELLQGPSGSPANSFGGGGQQGFGGPPQGPPPGGGYPPQGPPSGQPPGSF